MDHTYGIQCFAAIDAFVQAVRPTRYSKDALRPLELMEAESKLNHSWDSFAQLSTEGREFVRDKMLRSHNMYLWYYALHMAEMAVRRGEDFLIRFGLMALSIDSKFADVRDTYTALAVLLDAAKRINADTEQIFREVANKSSDKMRDRILQYYEDRGRDTELHSLAGVGYAATGSGETFRYQSSP